jgi:hypothetical protein
MPIPKMTPRINTTGILHHRRQNSHIDLLFFVCTFRSSRISSNPARSAYLQIESLDGGRDPKEPPELSFICPVLQQTHGGVQSSSCSHSRECHCSSRRRHHGDSVGDCADPLARSLNTLELSAKFSPSSCACWGFFARANRSSFSWNCHLQRKQPPVDAQQLCR